MKRLLAAAVLSSLSVGAHAQLSTCRDMEYAEIKDMAADDLQSAYCENVKVYRLAADMAKDTSNMGMLGEARAHRARAADCSKVMNKMETAMRAKGVDLEKVHERCPVVFPELPR